MRRFPGWVLCALVLAGSAGASQERNRLRVHQLKDLKGVKLAANGHPIQSWIMDNESKRNEGLMFVTDKEMRADQGALFLFSKEQAGPDYFFWMHNTLIPLDIVYIGRDRKVINIGNGKIKDDTPIKATRAYFYCLELKAGTSKKLGIKPGSKIEIPSGLASVD